MTNHRQTRRAIDPNLATHEAAAVSTDPVSVAIVLVLHLALIIPIAWTSSPNCDELAHLASGIYHWQVGRFDAYRVNPPLYRMWCTMPLAIAQPKVTWRATPNAASYRLEWCLVTQLLEATTPHELRRYLFSARLMGMPTVILGGISCYLWAQQRYGTQAALAALILWCFSPNVLSWGATLCPDVAGAAVGVCASYTLSRWLANNDWPAAINCGLLQGLSILTKSTWILLLITTPLLVCWYLVRSPTQGRLTKCAQGVLLIAISLTVINLGYGLEGTGTRLSKFEFNSELFRHWQARIQHGSAAIPWETPGIPLPYNFIMGIDQQRSDFEQGKWSYLLGKWNARGWYGYYGVCAAVKMPLGFWLLALWAASTRCLRGPRGRQPDPVETLALWLPLIGLAVFISSQSGFSRHFRYFFPCFPFAFVIAGQAARVDARNGAFRFLGVTSVLWFAASSVSTWPLCHSYFNELAGGPRQAYRFLLDSNVDWGEDVLRAERWLDLHPAADPVYRGFVTDEFASHRSRRWQPEPPTFSPGWYLVSIHRVMDPADRYSVLRQVRPFDRIGYSTLVYHLKADDIRRVLHRRHAE